MDIRKYEAVLRIAERGKFAQAAEDLGYTQSALSQMVASLETELGFRVLERSRAGSKLTMEGEQLLPFIERTIAAERSLRERADEINGLETGIVRMGTVSSISTYWLPPLMKKFEKDHPGVRFVIHQGDYSLIPEWINAGLVDFGFANPKAVSELEAHMLKSGPLSAVLPKGHRLAAYEVIPLEELAREPFILLEEGGFYEPIEAFAACGCKPNIKYTIHDDYSIMAMVEQGLGVTMLADLIMQKCPYDLEIRPTDPLVVREMALVYKRSDLFPVAAKRFMSLIIDNIASLP